MPIFNETIFSKFKFFLIFFGVMSENSIHQMRIFELRNKLKEVGLPSSGTKAELIARLTEYYENNKRDGVVQEDTKSLPKTGISTPFLLLLYI